MRKKLFWIHFCVQFRSLPKETSLPSIKLSLMNRKLNPVGKQDINNYKVNHPTHHPLTATHTFSNQDSDNTK